MRGHFHAEGKLLVYHKQIQIWLIKMTICRDGMRHIKGPHFWSSLPFPVFPAASGRNLCAVLLPEHRSCRWLFAIPWPQGTGHATSLQGRAAVGPSDLGLACRDFSLPNTTEIPHAKFCMVRIHTCKQDLDTNKYLARI